ncbi:MAG: hypothetical protein IJ617_07540 [Oscillospiraceae bacterium]|nr:hypothetical protein [Oscillospiraceae bacterium]
MLSYDAAGRILDAAAEALPAGIFDDLNGGVNLIEDEKTDGDGNYIMGLYHHDGMGRWVEIFYGSFAALYPEDDARFAEELGKTLRHELTHHVENKAGDRTLEHWDEEQKLRWEMGEPLTASSLLFVDGGGGLAAEAQALFRRGAAERGLDIPSAAAEAEDVTPALLEQYDAVMCMTLAQADELADRFPAQDEKIMCLGRKDIHPPLKHAARRLRREVSLLIGELCEDWE